MRLRARHRVNESFLRLIVQQRLTARKPQRQRQPRHRRWSLMDDKRLAPLVADWEPIVADNRLALAVFKIPVNSGLHLFRRRIFGRSSQFCHAVTTSLSLKFSHYLYAELTFDLTFCVSRDRLSPRASPRRAPLSAAEEPLIWGMLLSCICPILTSPPFWGTLRSESLPPFRALLSRAEEPSRVVGFLRF